MNIVLVHPHDIHSLSEPWTRRIKALAKELVRAGHRVKLVYFALPPKGSQPHFIDGYAAIPFRRSVSPLRLWQTMVAFTGLAEWADVVHFQKCHHYAALPAVAAAYLKGKPLHYDWDDWEEMIWYESCGHGARARFIGRYYRALERWLPVLSDTVSVASDSLRRLALRCGVKEENIYFTPVGADLDEFKPGSGAAHVRSAHNITGPLVLYVGQLHGAQYADLFIRAANVVLHRYPHVTFMLVGDGYRQRHLQEFTQELGIADRCIFTGAVGHQRIPEYIAAADICVATFKDTKVTRCKSPLKIVEYMASGKAVVASNVGEVRRMLGGVGILVEPGDHRALAEGIGRLLQDDDLRRRLGALARIRSQKHYNWESSAASLLAAYAKITTPDNTNGRPVAIEPHAAPEP